MTAAAPPIEGTPAPDRAAALRLFGAALVLVPLLARAMSLLSPLPGWDLDPLVFAGPMPRGIGPAESIAIDCLVLLGAALLALAARCSRRSLWPDGAVVLLLAIGAAAVLFHALAGSAEHGRSLGDHRIGISWLSGMLGAAALWMTRADGALRRAVAAVLLGFVVMLAAKGAQQWLVEHPQTVAAYRADPARYLAGQGFTPESPMARAFERRLLQPEATGWFGLSNVYATFAAAMFIALGTLAVFAVRARARLPRPAVAGAIAAAALAFGALAATGSKGGFIAAAGGLGALAATLIIARFALAPRIAAQVGAILGVLAVVGPVLLVMIRGQVGERIGELSLLFRWFYMQGAVRIFAQHPLGVGPDGFQQAYLLAKPPISPEEVTSPHSILFDWTADLGVAGLAWCVVLLLAAGAIGRAMSAAAALKPAPTTTAHPPTDRNAMRFVLLIPGLAVLAAAWIERGAITPDTALVRLFGLAGWCGAAAALLAVLQATRAWPLAMGAAALAIIAHAQIDVAASWTQSAGLVMVFVSIAAANAGAEFATAPVSRRPSGALALAALSLAAIVALNPVRAAQWQARLFEARAVVAEIGSLHERLASLGGPDSRGDSPEAIALALSIALDRRGALAPGQRVGSTPADVQRALARLESIDLSDAAEKLLEAAAIHPDDWRPRREASRLLLRASGGCAHVLNDPSRATELAADALTAMAMPDPVTDAAAAQHAQSPQWRWLAIVHQEQARLAEALGYPDRALGAATRSLAALERAATQDPWNLDVAVRAMRAAVQAGDGPAARKWAGKVLELAPLMRLDPAARGLLPADRAEAERLVQSP